MSHLAGLYRIAMAMLTCIAAFACADPIGPDDSQACRQTFEFGNTGCFEVGGQVVGSAGQPLSGIVVGPSYLPGRDLFNTVYSTTDENGSFLFRVSRYEVPAVTLDPDTVSVYIRAADPRSAGPDSPASVRDSILTVVTIAPVDSIPVTQSVRITLPVP
jgi:hypothetical protein